MSLGIGGESSHNIMCKNASSVTYIVVNENENRTIHTSTQIYDEMLACMDDVVGAETPPIIEDTPAPRSETTPLCNKSTQIELIQIQLTVIMSDQIMISV
jgi:hypothetical protein